MRPSLQQWRDTGWLTPFQPIAEETAGQLREVDRELADARQNISTESGFVIACNAALRPATIALSAAGFRASREQRHYRTIAALPLVIGDQVGEIGAFLDRCRVKRNALTYESPGAISRAEADELVSPVRASSSRSWSAGLKPSTQNRDGPRPPRWPWRRRRAGNPPIPPFRLA